MPYTFRQARRDDLIGIARVFTAAFPATIRHYFATTPSPHVVAEPFALCLAAEPEAFHVAIDDDSGRLVGYIFAPARTGRLPWVAVGRGFIFRWFWRWITGQYRIGLSPVRAMTGNKLDFLASAGQSTVQAEARILSVAVHPDHQGRGLARELCRRALQRLDKLGARPVRLEVRPENGPAVKLYRDLGFKETGRTHDAQGDWLIMLRRQPGATKGT